MSFKHRLRHYFLPHESNNYKAKALHAGVIFYYIILLLLFQFAKNLVKGSLSNVLGYAANITVEETLKTVNKKRIEAGLSPLSLSPELSTAATQKAADMFTKDYWAHVSPTGVTPWQFINSAGYQYIYAGENLAKSFDTTEDMVDAWMSSPTHRANILKPEYKEIGLAVMNGKLKGEETTLVVQEFGARTLALSPSAGTYEQSTSTASMPAVPAVVSYTNKQKTSSLPFLSFNLRFSKIVSLLLAEFLLIILLLDSIYIARNKTARVSSHSLAHIIFFATLIGAMTATGMGVIL